MAKPIYSEEECPLCDGKGTKVLDCSECDGRGYVIIHGVRDDCPECLNEPCEMCGGRRNQRRRF